MNSMDPLETLISNWTPRRPSPGLRRRLFGAATVAESPLPWYQFAPATLAVAAMALAFVLHPGQLHSAVRVSAFTNLAAATSYRHAALQCANNALPVACFAWTNTSLAPSTNGSVGGR